MTFIRVPIAPTQWPTNLDSLVVATSPEAAVNLPIIPEHAEGDDAIALHNLLHRRDALSAEIKRSYEMLQRAEDELNASHMVPMDVESAESAVGDAPQDVEMQTSITFVESMQDGGEAARLIDVDTTGWDVSSMPEDEGQLVAMVELARSRVESYQNRLSDVENGIQDLVASIDDRGL